jgi:predicted DNA-binding transcriptional regulator AlpA
MRRLIRYPDLRRLGIPWTRQHILKRQKARTFPKSFKLPGSHINCWYEDVILEWLAQVGPQAPRPST